MRSVAPLRAILARAAEGETMRMEQTADADREGDAAAHERMIETRRALHRLAEPSHREYETRAFVRAALASLGLESQSATGKDVHARIDSGRPGPELLIRADMDALPIVEQTGLPFAARNGAMHACGHDGHMAILLELARHLAVRGPAHGAVTLLFQHAEEVVPGGAEEIISTGFLDAFDRVLGFHLWQPFETGRIHVAPGAVMSGADQFALEIVGIGGHASEPHRTIDPIAAGASAVHQINAIVGRAVDPREAVVVGVGSFSAGDACNVIPDSAVLRGSVRYFESRNSILVERRLRAIAEGIEAAFGASARLDYERGEPPLRNDPMFTLEVAAYAAEALGIDAVQEHAPLMASEDFARYSALVPSCYLFIGAGSASHPHGHHHPEFDIDEDALLVGFRALRRIVERCSDGPGEGLGERE